MSNHKIILLVVACAMFCGINSNAERVLAPLTDKSVFGVGYDIAIMPKVARFVGDGGPLPLNQLIRAYLEVTYPVRPWMAIGVSIDYTLAMSPRDNNPELNFSREPAKIKSTFLGATAHIRPQWPIEFKNFDLIFYTEAQLGIGTSSPIAFGTEPLSEFEFKGTRNIPTPFPLMFETTPKLGVQLFGWRFIGLDAAAGFRTMWVVHPMVMVPSKKLKEDLPTDERSAIWYDITSPFVQIGLRFAF
jgi:hypothetical protein